MALRSPGITEPTAPNYYVQGSDGRFYGPADLPTLNQWATDGRILADTVLVDAATQQQTTAKQVPGLQHHYQLAPGFQQPYQPLAPYQPVAPFPISPAPPRKKVHAALFAFFLGMFGVHRFYLGHTMLGFLMVGVTALGFLGLCGFGYAITLVWSMIDFVLILTNNLKDANGVSLE